MSTFVPKLNLKDVEPDSDARTSSDEEVTDTDTETDQSEEDEDEDAESVSVPAEMALAIVNQTFYGEEGYMAVVSLLLQQEPLENRTDVACRSSLEIPTLTFECGESFPLMTHKDMTKTFPMVLQELSMFMRGVTDSNELAAKKNKIWHGNTTRKFLDARGLEAYQTGDMGPMYGFQWRHFGAPYPKDGFQSLPEDRGEIGGFDQLADLVRNLKENPTSRRLMLTSLNPAAVPHSVLAPCHVLFVCSVRDGVLYGHLTQRSADWMLGVPFNVASYAMLLRLLARSAGLQAGELRMTFVDAHIYETHVPKAEIALERDLHDPPQVNVADTATWDHWSEEDVHLMDYEHEDALRMKMVA